MELVTFLSDALIASGMFFFLVAEILQLRKITRKKTVRSLSYNTYKSKLAALIFTLGGLWLSGLWLSFGVLTSELITVLVIIKLMRKYRGK